MSLKLPSSISAAGVASVTPLPPPATSSPDGDGTPFKDVLSSAIQEVEGARTNASQSINQFLSGEGEDLHSTILASQRADLEFQMFLQVRNKVVSAYQEVMKMQM
jgi:flagellar hook-basal body complex protein FliE